MIALIYLAFLAGMVGGYVLRALMERANAESVVVWKSQAMGKTTDAPTSFPLTAEQKRAIVIDLNERRVRKAGR